MKMLVCSDGSSAAEHAVRLGALIAAACDSEITLLGIIENPGTTDPILDALRRGLQLLEEKRIRAELVTITGEPIAEIIKRTEQQHYDLVVIGATRKGSRGLFWVSSKAYKIIKTIQPPVLVVLEKSSGIKRILVCTGGQKYITNGIALTGHIARGMGASVTLFHVVPEPPQMYARLHSVETNVESMLNSKSELGRNLRDQKRILDEMGVNVEVKLGQGAVLSEIHQEIQSGNYDLVVTGSSQSRASLRTYILGDVTREIVNRATCAVMVVRSEIAGEGILQSLTGLLGRITHHSKTGKTGG